MRILERLDELAAIGDRIGYSTEEDRAHELASGWFRAAGLDVEVDAAGNLIGRVPGGAQERTEKLARPQAETNRGNRVCAEQSGPEAAR